MQVCIGLNESIDEEATVGQAMHLDACKKHKITQQLIS